MVRDRATLARIRALAIPPAWSDVWIAPTEQSHLQATGRDDRGRKQYRYHPAWRRRRETAKYERLLEFSRVLPKIRRRVRRDLRRRDLSREKVLAAVVSLLELTFIRVGNEAYAKLYQSFGLTTLRNRHAKVRGESVHFRFRGKSGRLHEVTLRDRRLANVVRRCRDLPGQDLFAWVDEDGEVRDVASDDVNDYLREAAGDDSISAKDFRTWAGTVLAVRALRAVAPPKRDREREAKATVRAAVEETAEQLGNTPTVARQSYVHPIVLESYLDDDLREALLRDIAPSLSTAAGSEDEAILIALLRARVRPSRRRAPAPARATTSKAASRPKKGGRTPGG